MVSVSQTSRFEIRQTEAFQALRVFPLTVPLSGTSSLLYRIDGDLKPGTLVSYRLVAGFRLIDWKGVIASVEKGRWTAVLKQGPFTFFQAEQVLISDRNSFECEDNFVFNGESPDFSEALKNTNVQYAFAARREARRAMDAFESRRKTESFEALDSGSVSAG